MGGWSKGVLAGKWKEAASLQLRVQKLVNVSQHLLFIRITATKKVPKDMQWR
jgi:hypothetical protein